MFKYILICLFLAHNIWAKPLRSHAEVAPHVLILTPQAQLRLESLVPGAPIIQHLTPFTSYLAPHEETVVYVPASAAAAVQNAELYARSIQGKRPQFDTAVLQGAFNQALGAGLAAATNAIEQTSSFVTNPSSFSPSDFGSTIVNTLTGSFPPLQSATGTPAQDPSQEQSQEQAQKLLLAHQLQEQQQLQLQHQKETQKLQQQQLLELQQKHKTSSAADVAISPIISAGDTKLSTISLATKIPNVPQLISPIIPSISLFANEPRHHYVVAPVAPHVVDILPNTVYLSPTVANTIKARRSVTNESKEQANPLTAIILPAIAKPEALPLKNDLEKTEQLNKDKQEEEFKRFLEADALKEESPLDNSDNILDKTLQKSEKKPTNAANKLADPNESSPKIEANSNDENDTPQTKDIKIEN